MKIKITVPKKLKKIWFDLPKVRIITIIFVGILVAFLTLQGVSLFKGIADISKNGLGSVTINSTVKNNVTYSYSNSSTPIFDDYINTILTPLFTIIPLAFGLFIIYRIWRMTFYEPVIM